MWQIWYIHCLFLHWYIMHNYKNCDLIFKGSKMSWFFPRLIWFRCTEENIILSPETWDAAPGLVTVVVPMEWWVMQQLCWIWWQQRCCGRRLLECSWKDLQMLFRAKTFSQPPILVQVQPAEAGLQLHAGPAGSIWQVELRVGAFSREIDQSRRQFSSCHMRQRPCTLSDKPYWSCFLKGRVPWEPERKIQYLQGQNVFRPSACMSSFFLLPFKIFPAFSLKLVTSFPTLVAAFFLHLLQSLLLYLPRTVCFPWLLHFVGNLKSCWQLIFLYCWFSCEWCTLLLMLSAGHLVYRIEMLLQCSRCVNWLQHCALGVSPGGSTAQLELALMRIGTGIFLPPTLPES